MIGFFADAGLSTPAARAFGLQASDGSPPPVDTAYYLGDPDGSRSWKAASDPGVDDITVSISDSSGGTLLPPEKIRLSLTQIDLASATPGAALNIGTEIAGGTANAVEVWVRVDSDVFAAGIYDNLILSANPVISVSV